MIEHPYDEKARIGDVRIKCIMGGAPFEDLLKLAKENGYNNYMKRIQKNRIDIFLWTT